MTESRNTLELELLTRSQEPRRYRRLQTRVTSCELRDYRCGMKPRAIAGGRKRESIYCIGIPYSFELILRICRTACELVQHYTSSPNRIYTYVNQNLNYPTRMKRAVLPRAHFFSSRPLEVEFLFILSALHVKTISHASACSKPGSSTGRNLDCPVTGCATPVETHRYICTYALFSPGAVPPL